MTSVTAPPYHSLFQAPLAHIQAFLETRLAPQSPQLLWDAMRYAVLNGGKRIRPVLILETCTACGGPVESALGTAGALEIIHAYSLIHDDLPCMDDDDLRRGQPTVHKAFSEAIAVLAGDALNAMAFGWIADYSPHVPAETRLALISALSRAASVEEGLVSGQVEDLLATQSAPSAEKLTRIHRGKTGALFRFSLWAGAKLAGQPDAVCETFRQLGDDLGVAFQIADDVLDVEGSATKLGKTPGKDAAQGKLTYPAVYGMDGAMDHLRDRIIRLNATMAQLPPKIQTGRLLQIVRFVEARDF